MLVGITLTWHLSGRKDTIHYLVCAVFLFPPGHRLLSDLVWQMAWYFEDLQNNFTLKCMDKCYPYYCKSGKIWKMSWTVQGLAKAMMCVRNNFTWEPFHSFKSSKILKKSWTFQGPAKALMCERSNFTSEPLNSLTVPHVLNWNVSLQKSVYNSDVLLLHPAPHIPYPHTAMSTL